VRTVSARGADVALQEWHMSVMSVLRTLRPGAPVIVLTPPGGYAPPGADLAAVAAEPGVR
jgi:hypothetical protein